MRSTSEGGLECAERLSMIFRLIASMHQVFDSNKQSPVRLGPVSCTVGLQVEALYRQQRPWNLVGPLVMGA